MKVLLNTIDKAIDFVNTVSQFDANIDLVSGRHMVDAKSLLGVFSLDLSNPINVEFNHAENQYYYEMQLVKFAVTKTCKEDNCLIPSII